MRTYTVTEYDREDYDAIKKDITDEEVLSLLEYIDRGWIPDYNLTGTESDFENYKLHLALWKAMDAIHACKERKRQEQMSI